jgi:hypothetical protein
MPSSVSESKTATTQAAPTTTQAATSTGEDQAPASKAAPRPEPPPVKLLEVAVERRLYAEQLEASSFLWSSWNRFQENYHPNYLMDGDPKTAWVEGVESSGKGEWITIPLSSVEGATTVRLRLQNGYQKSPALYKKNARFKKIQVTTLPSGETFTLSLKDKTGWQEFSFAQKEGPLHAITLTALEVYEGSKWKDLSTSELEIFVTAKTPENPSFEKSKLDKLLAWKSERVAAAEAWQKATPGSLPIAEGYRVVEGKEVSGPSDSEWEDLSYLRRSAERALTYLPEASDAAARAQSALDAGREKWVGLSVTAPKTLKFPLVDGLYAPASDEIAYGWRNDAFAIPNTEKHGLLLLSTGLKTVDNKDTKHVAEHSCTAGQVKFWRGPKADLSSPNPRELIVEYCAEEEGREGSYYYRVTQVLEFDSEGRLVLVVSDEDAQLFSWNQDSANPKVTGGKRVLRYRPQIDTLIEATAAAEK